MPAYLRPANVLPAAVAAFYAWSPATLDETVSGCWGALLSLDAVHAPMFEAQVAAGSFAAWIVFFSSIHLVMGERAAQHRFDGAMPHDPFSWARPANWYEAINPTVSYLASIQLCAAARARARDPTRSRAPRAPASSSAS